MTKIHNHSHNVPKQLSTIISGSEMRLVDTNQWKKMEISGKDLEEANV